MQPTLLILAAGMGSRYGGLKQVDPVGPNGEAIIDYSIYDAIRAGYGKIVFVIRKHFADAFRKTFDEKLNGRISATYVFQELNSLVPANLTVTPDRQKPWGTGHAVLVAQDAVKEPFVVINADDFYGPSSYQALRDYLTRQAGEEDRYGMVGYRLDKTLSEHGHVSRGICQTNREEFLESVVERTRIERVGNRIVSTAEEGKSVELKGDEVVSMNIWGFMPSFFGYLGQYFHEFIRQNAQNPKAELYIPYVVNDLIASKKITLKVLQSQDQWFGVTYREDKSSAVESIHRLIRQGIYPEKLWN